MSSASAQFQPSQYQQAIFDWIRTGSGNGLINAVAGSGKTTTLVEAIKYLGTSDVIFVAFNKHIAEALSQKLGKGITCRTIHGVGYSCLMAEIGKFKPDDSKYRRLIRPLIDNLVRELEAEYVRLLKQNRDLYPAEPPAKDALGKLLKSLVHYCQVSLTAPTDQAGFAQMVTCFDINLSQEYFGICSAMTASLMKEGERLARHENIISYDDMVYLPHIWKLAPKQFRWVLVDEAQDLSNAQRDLVFKLVARGGRLLAVGDPQQAVFAFTGADSESFWKIKETAAAYEMPLSVCYRCPTGHIELARQIVSQIEAAPTAAAGNIATIHPNKLTDIAAIGDLVICRLTAPLVEVCIKLISRNIPARVRGRDLSSNLTDLVKEVAGIFGYEWSKFMTWLIYYQQNQRKKLSTDENSEEQIEALNDRIAGVEACYLAMQVNDEQHLCREIENLFSDEKIGVILSTVHRAKGLEADRVFILRPEKLPLIWAGQQPAQYQQELNLRYVALTRAKQLLCFVSDEADEDAECELRTVKRSLPVTVDVGVGEESQKNASKNDSDLLHYVTDNAGLVQCLEVISNARVVGVDTETTGLPHEPGSKVSVIQLAIESDHGIRTWVIDCFVRLNLSPLAAILSDSSVLKVIHNASFDVKMIRKTFGWEMAGVYCTLSAERKAGHKGNSLKECAWKYFNIELDKTEQVSDWSRRPLTRSQIEYAALDAEIALKLYRHQTGSDAVVKTMVPQMVSEPVPVSASLQTAPAATLIGVSITEFNWSRVLLSLMEANFFDVITYNNQDMQERKERFQPFLLQSCRQVLYPSIFAKYLIYGGTDGYDDIWGSREAKLRDAMEFMMTIQRAEIAANKAVKKPAKRELFTLTA